MLSIKKLKLKKLKVFISIISVLITSSALSMQVLGPHDSNIRFLLVQNFPAKLIKQIPGYKTKEKDTEKRDLVITITAKNTLYIWDVKSKTEIYKLDLNSYSNGLYIVGAKLIEKNSQLNLTVLLTNHPRYTNTKVLTFSNLGTKKYSLENKKYFEVLKEYLPSYKSHAAYQLSYQPNNTISHHDYDLKINNNLVITHKTNNKKVTIKNILPREIVCVDPKKDSPYIILHNNADEDKRRSFDLYNHNTGQLISKITPDKAKNYFVSSILLSQMFGDHHDFVLFRIKNVNETLDNNKNLAYIYDLKLKDFVFKEIFRPYPEGKFDSFETLLISKSEDDRLIFVPNYENIYIYKNPVIKYDKIKSAIKNNDIKWLKNNIKSDKYKFHHTLLDDAISIGNIVVMRFILEKCSNINTKDKKGNSPLYKAAQKGDKKIVDLFLQKLSFDECSICLDKFEPNETLEVTKCGHIFHTKCIVTWKEMYKNKNCPVCSAKQIADRKQISYLSKIIKQHK